MMVQIKRVDLARKTSLVLVVVVIAFAQGQLARGPLDAMIWALGLFLAAAVIGAPLWRGMDEVRQEAEKASSYWGGRIGLVVGLLLLIGVSYGEQPLIARLKLPSDPALILVLGFSLAVFSQLVGASIFRAGWWLARR